MTWAHVAWWFAGAIFGAVNAYFAGRSRGHYLGWKEASEFIQARLGGIGGAP